MIVTAATCPEVNIHPAGKPRLPTFQGQCLVEVARSLNSGLWISKVMSIPVPYLLVVLKTEITTKI